MNSRNKNFSILSLALALVASAAVTGCDASKGDLQNAQKFSEALGVPVFLWASSEDVCGQAQFHAILDEYNAASEAERSILIGEAKRYDAIIFNGSQIVSPLTGKLYELQLAPLGAVSEERTVEDARSFRSIGLTGTTVVRGAHLVINPQSAPDHTTTRIYRTGDAELYALIVKGGGNYLEDAAAAGKLEDVTPASPANPVNCGNPIHLRDLL